MEAERMQGKDLLEIEGITRRLRSWTLDNIGLIDLVFRPDQATSGNTSGPGPEETLPSSPSDGNASASSDRPADDGDVNGHSELRHGLRDANTGLNNELQLLKFQYRNIIQGLDRLDDRAHQLSQTRLISIQIAESRKAIQQADSVRRLTTLAFIFIPLTYVASVFGADIVDMAEERSSRNFAIASVATTLATILAAMVLEQYLWPAIMRPLNAWKSYVYYFLSELDDDGKTFSIWKCVFRWTTYEWNYWHLDDTPLNWALLPLATLNLGRYRLRQLLRKFRSNKVQTESNERRG
ncbi:hypothetical protein B0T14DRAFT_599098 [Immersiella caudata]|uniref:Uncharacterized protein n=1 Tax=Immersiella caudata TaxID=314043 RepID=A0AA40CE02_9PEZI|nr:hypothetical protein B0T14DRAFT_599098 [Immersiella caudata]